MMISINRPRRRTDFCKGGVMKRSIFVLSLVLMMSSVGFERQPLRPSLIQTVLSNWFVPLPPGAQGDVSARILADEMAKILGTQIIVVNKPGAAFDPGNGCRRSKAKRMATLSLYEFGSACVCPCDQSRGGSLQSCKDLEPLGVTYSIL